ncbi:MAG: copper chaperone PCu(A)C [Pseudomonadota bacterium]
MKTYFWKKFAAVIMLLAPLACFGESNIRVDDPWVREAPPNVKVLAAYMIIENPTSEQRILISATASSSFKSVEIHRTVITQDGMMQMRHQPQLIIHPKSQVVLKPGSYHLMLMGPKKSLIAGDKVDLTFKFANGEEISIAAPVRRR